MFANRRKKLRTPERGVENAVLKSCQIFQNFVAVKNTELLLILFNLYYSLEKMSIIILLSRKKNL